MTKEEIIEAIADDDMMPFIQPEQLAGIVDFVIKNYKSSLPSNLDEAAGKIAWDIAPMYPDISWDNCFEKIKKGIKAGAEWMAGQGITLEGKASRKYENGLAGFVSWVLFDQQKAAHLLINQGEEADVIINIRKK